MMDPEQIIEDQHLIKKAYAAFNARDIDAILPLMHSDVKWPRAWEGDYANGHDEVRAYWQRQWLEINPLVTPLAFKERESGKLEVEVGQLVKDMDGNTIFDGKVMHVYIIINSLIKQMDIETVK